MKLIALYNNKSKSAYQFYKYHIICIDCLLVINYSVKLIRRTFFVDKTKPHSINNLILIYKSHIVPVRAK